MLPQQRPAINAYPHALARAQAFPGTRSGGVAMARRPVPRAKALRPERQTRAPRTYPAPATDSWFTPLGHHAESFGLSPYHPGSGKSLEYPMGRVRNSPSNLEQQAAVPPLISGPKQPAHQEKWSEPCPVGCGHRADRRVGGDGDKCQNHGRPRSAGTAARQTGIWAPRDRNQSH